MPCIGWGTSKAYYQEVKYHVLLQFLAVLFEQLLVELGALLASQLPPQVLLLLLLPLTSIAEAAEKIGGFMAGMAMFLSPAKQAHNQPDNVDRNHNQAS